MLRRGWNPTRVLVVGCGRLGAHLACRLAADGHDVRVIDEDPASFDRLASDFPGRLVRGTGFDEDVLREAGADECDMVAAMTNRDATNYMVVEAVRRLFHVERVVVRVNDPEFDRVFREMDMATVSLPALAEARVRELLGGGA
jgi:trk system potassium uptake protein TrkA